MYSLFDNLISRYAPDCTLAGRYAVHVTYTSLDHRDRYSDEFTLDIGVARDSGYVTEKTIHDVAEALEKLRDTVVSWTIGNGIRAYTVDAEAYEHKQIQAMRERLAQFSDAKDPAPEDSEP